METEPFKLCPRFDNGCCVNKCPLHPDFKKLLSDESDPQVKCTLPKSIRKRLGASLSWKGLTDREISGQKRWDSLPEEVKQERIKKISERSLFARLSKKGYAITPKRKDKSKTHIQNDQIPQNSSVETGSSGRPEEVQGVLR
jgi:hypothetical protein